MFTMSSDWPCYRPKHRNALSKKCLSVTTSPLMSGGTTRLGLEAYSAVRHGQESALHIERRQRTVAWDARKCFFCASYTNCARKCWNTTGSSHATRQFNCMRGAETMSYRWPFGATLFDTAEALVRTVRYRTPIRERKQTEKVTATQGFYAMKKALSRGASTRVDSVYK